MIYCFIKYINVSRTSICFNKIKLNVLTNLDGVLEIHFMFCTNKHSYKFKLAGLTEIILSICWMMGHIFLVLIYDICC